MKNYKPESYGNRIAAHYDEVYPSVDKDMIKRLVEFAGNGSAFELGIGTGRVAIPLVQRGIAVNGIDASKEMVKILKSKPGASRIEIPMGDFSKFETKKKYDLVYVVFNTFFALLSQEAQVSCFKSVYKALKPKGLFVIEAFVPDVCRFDRGQTLRTVGVDLDTVRVESSVHDPSTQIVTSQLVNISEAGIRLHPVKIRYAWPSELNLMAQVAGFKLATRWSNWQKAEFNSWSGFHISAYRKQ